MKHEIVQWIKGSRDYARGLDILKRCNYAEDQWKSLEKKHNPEMLKYLLRQAFHKGIVPALPVKSKSKREKQVRKEQPSALKVQTVDKKVISKKSELEQKKSPYSTLTNSSERKAGFIKSILNSIQSFSMWKKVRSSQPSTTGL